MKCKEIKIGDVMDALIKMCGEPVYKVIVEDSQGNQIAVPTFYLPATTRQIGGIKDGGHIKKTYSRGSRKMQ